VSAIPRIARRHGFDLLIVIALNQDAVLSRGGFRVSVPSPASDHASATASPRECTASAR
jgi:hypothetical protein